MKMPGPHLGQTGFILSTLLPVTLYASFFAMDFGPFFAPPFASFFFPAGAAPFAAGAPPLAAGAAPFAGAGAAAGAAMFITS